jgi:hypothetical protein
LFRGKQKEAPPSSPAGGLLPPVLRIVIPRQSAADGDYRKVGNGTTTRALRFVSILKSHHSSNRSHQRQVPKGVRALLRFRNGLHDGRAHIRGNMRYCSFQPVCKS